MDRKKIFTVLSVLIIFSVSAVICAPGSSADSHEDMSMNDAVFSRATVTYLKDACYGEQMDRTDCWFFIAGSSNEQIFISYVTGQSAAVPSADDRNELNDRFKDDRNVTCNIYNLGIEPKFKVNEPLLTIDYVHVVLNKGQRMSVTMDCSTCDSYIIRSSSNVTNWYCGRQYMTTATEDDTSLDILPNNESLSGGTIDIKDLFVKVSYDVKITSGTEFNGDNVVIAAVLFIIGAAAVAVLILCSKRIPWAKDAKGPKMTENDCDDGDS